MKNLSLLAFFFSIYACSSINNTSLVSPLESMNYTKPTQNNELVSFLEKCQIHNSHIKYSNIGYSALGKPIPLVEISDGSERDKISVFLFAQQHGNEPSGKEGLIRLIKEMANGNHEQLLDRIDLFIMPQCNPDGGDLNKRTNADSIDLNRNHLLLTATESQLIQTVFDKYLPEFSVDFHEYYPYGDSWRNFGYLKNFDIQLGGLTHTNIDASLLDFYYAKAQPFVQEFLAKEGYSFSEYLLGSLAEGERLRRSTVDISDGRQSIGITNTLSFIVEGKRGVDSLDLMERRSNSQYITALALLNVAYNNKKEIVDMVHTQRSKLSIEEAEKVAIRLEHIQGPTSLTYVLRSEFTNKDTAFIVDNFHSKVVATLEVESPKGYLVPKNDTLLIQWLKRTNFNYKEYPKEAVNKTFRYKIKSINSSKDEGQENKFVNLGKERFTLVNTIEYYYIPCAQLYKYNIVTALEPQSMYGLANYPEFDYLLNEVYFPILRVE